MSRSLLWLSPSIHVTTVSTSWGLPLAGEVLDLVEQAYLTFEGAAGGEVAFGVLKGFLEVRYGARDGAACAEFREGYDDHDPACGSGWVIIGTAGRLAGHFFIHNADKSSIVCEPK